MLQADFEAFNALLSAVSELYGKPPSPMMQSLFWGALREYDFTAIRQAFDRHVKNPDTGQFMPKPADVIRMLAGTTQDAALVAWAKVDRTLRQVGPYRDVVFDDPLIHRALADMGGWIPLGEKTDDEWPFVAKEFENRYRGYKLRNETPEYPKILTGIANAQNSVNRKAVEQPMLVGDPIKARQVMIGGTDKTLLKFTPASEALRLVAAPEKIEETA